MSCSGWLRTGDSLVANVGASRVISTNGLIIALHLWFWRSARHSLDILPVVGDQPSESPEQCVQCFATRHSLRRASVSTSTQDFMDVLLHSCCARVSASVALSGLRIVVMFICALQVNIYI